MTTQTRPNVRSEKGIALVIVLLLLAVMSALTTGLTMTGQTEVAMSANEMYYAGARAAAEAGLNRATEHLNDVDTLNLLSGADDAVDPFNPSAAVNADNGRIPTIGNGPFTLADALRYLVRAGDAISLTLKSGHAMREVRLTPAPRDVITAVSLPKGGAALTDWLGPNAAQLAAGASVPLSHYDNFHAREVML